MADHAAEGGADFHLTIAKLERQSSGKLLWEFEGTIDGTGIAYTANANGSKVRKFDPTSPEISGVPSSITRLQKCISRAKGDPTKLQACTAQYGTGG